MASDKSGGGGGGGGVHGGQERGYNSASEVTNGMLMSSPEQ